MSTDTVVDLPDAADGSERPPVRRGTIALFLAAYIGAYLILIVPVASTLAIKVAEVAETNRETVLGLIMGIGAFVAMVAAPVFGHLSDRTRSRLGRRRPWILAGTLVGVAALMVLALGQTPLVVGIAWAVVQLSLNATLAGLAAFLPDRVPENQRGKVSALAGIAQQLAPFLGLVIANIALGVGGGTLGMFAAPSAIGLLLVLLFALRVSDPPLQAAPLPVGDSIPKRVQISGAARRDFLWAWVGRFLITLSFASISTYQVYFLNDRLGIPLDQVPAVQLGLVLLSTVLLSLSAAVSGVVSDRIRRRKPLVIVASVLVGVASLIIAFAPSLLVFYVACAINGIAMGAYFAVDLALVTDVLPDREGGAARDMGIFNIANTLPQSLAPAVAPLLLAIGGAGANYAALFIAGAIVACLGALATMPIRSVR